MLAQICRWVNLRKVFTLAPIAKKRRQIEHYPPKEKLLRDVIFIKSEKHSEIKPPLIEKGQCSCTYTQ